MASTLFISDLHLDPARPAVTAALADFLGQRAHCEQLYILGDLFEAWPGDDDDSALGAEVRRLLRDFVRGGPRLAIMVGNRDFLLGRRFCDAVGARLLQDPSVIDLYGEPTVLLHGDSLCVDDMDYQAFRSQARDPAWQRELLSQPLAARRNLAARLRAVSREANSMKSEDIMDVTPAEVERQMRAHGVRRIIHGHTHRPARHDETCGERWVLGAWEDKAWYLETAPGTIELKYFNIIQ